MLVLHSSFPLQLSARARQDWGDLHIRKSQDTNPCLQADFLLQIFSLSLFLLPLLPSFRSGTPPSPHSIPYAFVLWHFRDLAHPPADWQMLGGHSYTFISKSNLKMVQSIAPSGLGNGVSASRKSQVYPLLVWQGACQREMWGGRMKVKPQSLLPDVGGT